MNNDIDFVRDGCVGDDVWHPIYGNGKIHEIVHSEDDEYGLYIIVLFKEGRESRFLPCGDEIFPVWVEPRTMNLPLLCWGHRDKFDRGVPPKRNINSGGRI